MVVRLFRLFSCLLTTAMLVAAPTASAATRTLGSDLKAPANVVEAHGADSAFWNVALQSGGQAAAPVGGQVISVRVKGIVLNDPSGRIKPRTMIHFQTIQPQGDGTMKVLLSSAPFYVPLGGNPQTISTYNPVNMCLHKGDFLDFNDIGGNEWHWGPYSGMPFQTFSAVRGSALSFYTKNRGTNIGSAWAPMWTRQGEELLMQMKFASGPDATDICPGGYKQHVFKGLDMRDKQAGSGSITVRTTCPSPTYGSCKGVIRAVTVRNGQQVTLGNASFSVPHSASHTIDIPVNGIKSGSAQVRLIADSHDDPAHDSRTYYWRVFARTRDDVTPVQHRTTSESMTVSAADLKKRR
jgi:hypothetical protein